MFPMDLTKKQLLLEAAFSLDPKNKEMKNLSKSNKRVSEGMRGIFVCFGSKVKNSQKLRMYTVRRH